MKSPSALRSTAFDLVAAFIFLTRLPMPPISFDDESLARSVKFFPIVGLVLGGGVSLLHAALFRHFPPMLSALMVLLVLVLATGGLHEDGLADVADAFGGGLRDRIRILAILRDSRIGSYGAIALVLSLLARVLLLANLPAAHFAAYVIAAHVLCRWSSLPLSRWLLPARAEHDGLGSHIAKRTAASSLLLGSLLTLAVVLLALHLMAVAPISITLLVVLFSGLFYRDRLGGITGDCFGATNQITEIAVLCCGVWIR